MRTRNEVPLYEKKLQDLHVEVESLASVVSDKQGENTRLSSENLSLEKKLNQLNAEITLKETHVKNLDSVISRKENQLYDLNEQSAKKEQEHQDKIKTHTENLETLGRSLKIHEQKIAEYKEIISQVSSLEDKRSFLTSELTRLEGELKEKSVANSLESDELEKKRAEVRDEIEKNGKILSEIVAQKGEVENWVRTLQRYYDESNINMQILSIFGLEKGNC